MRRIAYLTTPGLGPAVDSDALTVGPLRRLGLSVESISWRADEDWSRFAAVLPRSPWDYHLHRDAFFGVLERIETSGTPLFNGLATLRWNADKRYLGELAERGVPVVPTSYGTRLDPATVSKLAERFGTTDLVLKPTVSASAEATFRVRPGDVDVACAQLDGIPWLAQPFMPAVIEDGEYSLVYIDGRYSHGLRKRCRVGDFRVQEEHGGTIEPIDAGPDLLATAASVLAALPADLLYARIDLVRDEAGFRLMEAELLEPSLYFDLDRDAPERFARALAARLDGGS